MCDLGSEARELEDLDGSNGTTKCIRCGCALDLSNLAKVLEHAGAHILHDPRIDPEDTLCGFCLRPASQCPIYLRKSGGGYQIDFKRSRCPLIQPDSKLQYAAASRSSKSSPCSNIPVPCHACVFNMSSPVGIVWKYNLKQHFLTKHPSQNGPHVGAGMNDDEISLMGAIWKTISSRPKRPAVSTSTSSMQRLAVSLAHCTSVALS